MPGKRKEKIMKTNNGFNFKCNKKLGKQKSKITLPKKWPMNFKSLKNKTLTENKKAFRMLPIP